MSEEYYVETVGGIDLDTKFGNLKELWESLDNYITITLPPWLQRKLQEDEWFNDSFTKSKNYMSSATMGTLRFEPFLFVRISLLINELTQRMDILDEDVSKEKEEKQEIQESIDFIKKYPSAEYIIIDGQSRGYLSIVKFFQNEIQFNKSFTLRRKNKKTNHIVEEFNLKGRFFKDMPAWVREHIFSLKYIRNEITSGKLSDIVEALISKQLGVQWEKFQMIYAEHAYSNIFTRLRECLTAPIIDFYKKCLKDIPAMYRDEVNGLEFVFTNWLLYLRDKSFPDIKKIKRTCEYKDMAPSLTFFKTFKSYLDEFRKYWTSIKTTKKVKLKLWFTYGLFRDLLDKGNSSDKYYEDFGLNNSFNILRKNEFCKWFMEKDTHLMSKITTDAMKIHWEEVKDRNGKIKKVKREGGYPASYGGDQDELISNRLYWIVQEFKKSEQNLIDNGTISIVEPKPDINDIIVNNDNKDADGNDVDPRKKYDAGHIDAESITGDNSIENFVPQDPKANKQYSDTELIR